jgi:hypothetical protein
MSAPTWLDEEDDDLATGPHEHTLYVTRLTGAIRCRRCDLRVPRPDRMPDYSRAGMGRWA